MTNSSFTSQVVFLIGPQLLGEWSAASEGYKLPGYCSTGAKDCECKVPVNLPVEGLTLKLARQAPRIKKT